MSRTDPEPVCTISPTRALTPTGIIRGTDFTDPNDITLIFNGVEKTKVVNVCDLVIKPAVEKQSASPISQANSEVTFY